MCRTDEPSLEVCSVDDDMDDSDNRRTEGDVECGNWHSVLLAQDGYRLFFRVF